MNQYYIYVNDNQEGPFSLSELIDKKIEPNTLIWYSGLSGWLPAKEISELRQIIIETPPAPPTTVTPPPVPASLHSEEDYEPAKILGLKKSYFYTAVSVIVLALIITAFNINQDSYVKQKTEEQTHKEQERILIQQQQQIAEQNKRIEEQEKLENERRVREAEKAKQERIDQLKMAMLENYTNVEAAKTKLNKATSFQLLRSQSERNRDINEAQTELNYYNDLQEKLETEMKKINPDWGE